MAWVSGTMPWFLAVLFLGIVFVVISFEAVMFDKSVNSFRLSTLESTRMRVILALTWDGIMPYHIRTC